MKKVLISAFKPFYKANNNYSEEVLRYIQFDDIELTKIILDVVYDECFIELEKKDLSQFDLIVALGEARSRNELTIEKKAYNISSCSIVDNKGVLKKDEKIIDNLPNELETSINLEKIKEYATISYDPGKFVCNNLYFHLLNYDSKKCVFIHIPECNNDEEKYIKYSKDVLSIIKKIL